MSLAASIALCLLSATPATGPIALPADWPPLPDFTRRIDYIQWYLDQVAEADEGSLIWEELFGSSDDPPDVQARRDRLWGYDEKGRLPGLFTTVDPPPEKHAWGPAHHPGWEKVWQTQRANMVQVWKLDQFARAWHQESHGDLQPLPIIETIDKASATAASTTTAGDGSRRPRVSRTSSSGGSRVEESKDRWITKARKHEKTGDAAAVEACDSSICLLSCYRAFVIQRVFSAALLLANDPSTIILASSC